MWLGSWSNLGTMDLYNCRPVNSAEFDCDVLLVFTFNSPNSDFVFFGFRCKFFANVSSPICPRKPVITCYILIKFAVLQITAWEENYMWIAKSMVVI